MDLLAEQFLENKSPHVRDETGCHGWSLRGKPDRKTAEKRQGTDKYPAFRRSYLKKLVKIGCRLSMPRFHKPR